MRICANRSFLATFRLSELRNNVLVEPVEDLEAPLKSKIKGAPFKPTAGQNTVLGIYPSITDPSIVPELWNLMRKMAVRKMALKEEKMYLLGTGLVIDAECSKRSTVGHIFCWIRENRDHTEKCILLFHWKAFTEIKENLFVGRHVST